MANEVLEPLGAHLAPNAGVGRELVRDVGDEIQAAYRAVVPNMQGYRDRALGGEMARIANTLPPDQRNAFSRFVDREFDNVAPAPPARAGQPLPPTAIDGEDMQHLIGTLRAEATHLTTSSGSSFHDRELGRAFGDAAEALTNNLRTHTPPDVVEGFLAANAAFARLVALEKAAGSLGGDASVFTPAQLLNAVKATDRTARKRGFARGEGNMQQLADDAKTVMTRRVNDSGTPERGAIIAALAAPSVVPIAALTALPIAALYTGVGNRAFRYAAAGSPIARERTRRLIQQLTDRAAPGAGLAATAGN